MTVGDSLRCRVAGSLIVGCACIPVPNFLNEGIPATTANLNSEIQNAQKQCYKYTSEVLSLLCPGLYCGV